MKRIWIVILLLGLAGLACSLTTSDEETQEVRTPTPIRISNVEATSTVQARTSTPVSVNASPTPVAAPPTLRPTLLPTPVQFNTPVPAVGISQGVSSEGQSSGVNVASSSGASLSGSGSGAAAGAPQANGFYFPNTIVFSSGGSIRSIGRDGSGGGVIASGNSAIRSLNGLFVATASGGVNVVRPDGTAISQGSGLTTLPTWSSDGNTAYFGSGSSLIRFQNGVSQVVDSTNGDIIVVEYGPDGGTLMFASRNQIKLIYGDGTVGTVWDSFESINIGPFWAYRNDQLGVYIETSGGKRLFIGGGVNEITSPFEHLQLQSPANGGARVYVRARNDGYLTLVASYPGASDVEFTAPTLQDVSWSPDSSQLIYASTSGDLIILDAATGAQQVIAAGVGARYPVWTPPRYLLRE
jgi:hypothetical protein